MFEITPILAVRFFIEQVVGEPDTIASRPVTSEQPVTRECQSACRSVVVGIRTAILHLAKAMEGLRPGGRPVTTAVSAKPVRGHPVQMLFKQTSITGAAPDNPADLVDILGLLAAGKVKPQLEIYPVDEINRVLARLAGGKVRRRAVVTHN